MVALLSGAGNSVVLLPERAVTRACVLGFVELDWDSVHLTNNNSSVKRNMQRPETTPCDTPPPSEDGDRCPKNNTLPVTKGRSVL